MPTTGSESPDSPTGFTLPRAGLLACAPADLSALRLGEVRAATVDSPVRGAWVTDLGKDPDSDLGPLSLAPTSDGIALLDQENQRILRYDGDGALAATTPIPSRTTLDLVAADDGYALLTWDRPTTTWSAQRIDAAGTLLGEARAPAAVDAPSGLFLDGETVLIEQAHDRLYDPVTGTAYPGRPVGDGRYLRAEKAGSDRLLLTWQDADGGNAETLVVTPDRPLGNVVSLDTRDGYTLVTLFLYDEGAAPDYAMIDPELRVVLLDPGHRRTDEISLPPAAQTVLTREVVLGPEGKLWRLRTQTDGAALDRVAMVRR